MLSWKKTNRYELRMQDTLNLIFQECPKLLAFLFEKDRPRLRAEPEHLLLDSAVFSSGERVLVRVGLSLWNGSVEVSLWDIVERLDVINYRNVLAGLLNLRQTTDAEEGILWRQPKTACHFSRASFPDT
jgi:hypothetical protein